MTPPAGTFLAKVRNGAIQLPPPVKQYCEAMSWSLFRIAVMEANHLTMEPVFSGDPATDFQASLDADGKLWVPAELRQAVSLGEQSVMLRIEQGAVHVYIRKVFETLGFRPP